MTGANICCHCGGERDGWGERRRVHSPACERAVHDRTAPPARFVPCVACEHPTPDDSPGGRCARCVELARQGAADSLSLFPADATPAPAPLIDSSGQTRAHLFPEQGRLSL